LGIYEIKIYVMTVLNESENWLTFEEYKMLEEKKEETEIKLLPYMYWIPKEDLPALLSLRESELKRLRELNKKLF
jgi:hypothetical protein